MYDKNPISDKQKIKYALTFIGLVIVSSAISWILTGHWYGIFYPAIAIYLFQWVYDAYNLRYFYPPLTQPLVLVIKRKIRALKYHYQRKANGLGEISTTADQLPQPKQMGISDWLVTDMINATCTADYSSCGNRETYERLMCEYSDAKADADLVLYKSEMKDRLLLQADILTIRFNIEILKDRWSTSAAEALRRYNLRPFTPASCEDDIRFMEAFLIGQNLKLEGINETINSLFKGGGKTINTVQEYTTHIEDLLVEMAEVQKGAIYDLEGMKVSKLAAIERARTRHIKNLNDQIKRQKTGK